MMKTNWSHAALALRDLETRLMVLHLTREEDEPDTYLKALGRYRLALVALRDQIQETLDGLDQK